MLIAVAWAAMFVPFLVCLNPSIPQLRINTGTPLSFVMLIIVLFGETFMLQIGIFSNGIPSNVLRCELASGKMETFLKEIHQLKFILFKSTQSSMEMGLFL